MISVVIPLFNKRNDIGRAVASVLAQSHADWELWVVDDGSTDGSEQVVQQFTDPRIHLVHQANAGVSAARNTGADMARSECVAFLDADDFWDADHLDNLSALLKAYPQAALWATAYKVVSESGQSRCIKLPPSHEGKIGVIQDYFSHVLAHEHPVHSSAVMVRKSALKQVGGFPVGVTQGEDLIVWARLSCLGTLAYSGKATASYVAPPVSFEHRQRAIRRPQTPDPVGQVLVELLRRTRLDSLRKFLADWHRIRAMLFMECNERLNSVKELKMAICVGSLRLRDVASLVLVLMPSSTRQWALAALRRGRGRA